MRLWSITPTSPVADLCAMLTEYEAGSLDPERSDRHRDLNRRQANSVRATLYFRLHRPT